MQANPCMKAYGKLPLMEFGPMEGDCERVSGFHKMVVISTSNMSP